MNRASLGCGPNDAFDFQNKESQPTELTTPAGSVGTRSK